MPSERRWPTTEEVIEKARRGIIDDSMDAVSIFELDEEEVAELEREAREAERQRRTG